MLSSSTIKEYSPHASQAIRIPEYHSNVNRASSSSPILNYWPTHVDKTDYEAASTTKPAYCRLQSTQFDYYIRFLPFGLIFNQEASKLHVCKSRKASQVRHKIQWNQLIDMRLVDVHIEFNAIKKRYELTVINDRSSVTVDGRLCFQHDRITLFNR